MTRSVSSRPTEERWRTQLATTFAGVQTRALDSEVAVTGALQASNLGDVGCFEVHGSPQQISQTPRSLRRNDVDVLKICVQVRGRAVIEQRDVSVEISPGQLAVYDAGRPYSLELLGEWKCLIMTVPHGVLRLPDQELKRLMSSPLPSTSGAASLLTAYLSHSIKQHPANPIEGARIRDAGLSLLEGTFAANATHLDSGADLRARVIDLIRRSLDDPALSHASVAAACRMSVRSLHRLFEGSGTTVSETIRHQRLEAVRRDLENPLLQHRTIAAIAARWCLYDQPWLSRAFKQHFGVAPSVHRAARLASFG